MPDAIDVALSQLLAVSVPVAAFAVIYNRRFFHPRYRRAVLSVLAGFFLVQLAWLPAFFIFRESRLEWRLRQEGVSATARILASHQGGSYSARMGRGHLNWERFWEVTCEYSDGHGEKYRGEVEVYPAMPHSPGDAVAVRYIPSDPTIVREEYRIREARKPLPKLVFVPIAWVVNAIFAAWLGFRTVRKKRRAVALGIADFPY